MEWTPCVMSWPGSIFYSLKEDNMRRAWNHGPLHFDGATIQLLPDLSRHTLRMRAMLKPLLEVISTADATYHWPPILFSGPEEWELFCSQVARQTLSGSLSKRLPRSPTGSVTPGVKVPQDLPHLSPNVAGDAQDLL